MEAGETADFTPTGTDYVMLAGASISSDKMSLNNVSAACTLTDKYTVTCSDDQQAVIVRHSGLRLLEQNATIVNPDEMGNLSYISGGTSTVAIPPSRDGDPVINYMLFPAGHDQAAHIHPSHRIGFCLRGKGRTALEDGTSVHLKKGEVFFMERMLLHHFVTDDEDCVLFVFAPDSEGGPTDEYNPLKIRTYLQRT